MKKLHLSNQTINMIISLGTEKHIFKLLKEHKLTLNHRINISWLGNNKHRDFLLKPKRVSIHILYKIAWHGTSEQENLMLKKFKLDKNIIYIIENFRVSARFQSIGASGT